LSGLSAAQIANLLKYGLIGGAALATLGGGGVSTRVPTRARTPVTFGSTAGLVNPGVNPGFIRPTTPYPQATPTPGVNQYNWAAGRYAANMGELGQYNAYAPAYPFGRADVVGTYNNTGLIRPDQLTMASQTLRQPEAQFPVQPAANYYVNPALFGAPSQAQMAAGTGPAGQFGQSLNYVAVPRTITPNYQPLQSTATAALTPQQLQQQLTAQAAAAAAATPESGYYSWAAGDGG
jgi:hypothetical protein